MGADNTLRLACPECGADLAIDADTGKVLYHKQAASPPAGGQTLESLMQDMKEGKARSEEVFEQEKAAYEDRDRLLERKFREAMSRADDLDDGERPVRPFDLD